MLPIIVDKEVGPYVDAIPNHHKDARKDAPRLVLVNREIDAPRTQNSGNDIQASPPKSVSGRWSKAETQ